VTGCVCPTWLVAPMLPSAAAAAGVLWCAADDVSQCDVHLSTSAHPIFSAAITTTDDQ
jgi:hypothetical protein